MCVNGLIFMPGGIVATSLPFLVAKNIRVGSSQESSLLQSRIHFLNLSLKIHTEPQNLITRGQLYALGGDYKLAISDFEAALKCDSTHHDSYFFLGLVKDSMGLYEEATELYTESLNVLRAEQKKTSSRDYANVITTFNKLSVKWNKKIRLFNKDIDSDDVTAERQAKRESDREFFEKILTYLPNKQHVLNNRAMAYFHNKSYGRAINDLSMVIQLATEAMDPQLHCYLFNLGLAYFYEHNFQEAITLLTKALDLYMDTHMVCDFDVIPYFMYRANAFDMIGDVKKRNKDISEASFIKVDLNKNPLHYALLSDNCIEHVLSFLDFNTITDTISQINHHLHSVVTRSKRLRNYHYVTMSMTQKPNIFSSYINFVSKSMVNATAITIENPNEQVLQKIPLLFENMALKSAKLLEVDIEMQTIKVALLKCNLQLESLNIHFVSNGKITIKPKFFVPFRQHLRKLTIVKGDMSIEKMFQVLDACGSGLTYFSFCSGRIKLTIEDIQKIKTSYSNLKRIATSSKCLTQEAFDMCSKENLFVVKDVTEKLLYEEVQGVNFRDMMRS